MFRKGRIMKKMLFALFASLIALTAAISSVPAQDKIPVIDLSQETDRQTVIAEGTPEVYQGHPYSVQMPDGQTIFVVWCLNHGGFAGPMAKSVDGGRTWERLDDRLPAGYRKHKNCPSIYRMVNAEGKSFLWVFTALPRMPRIVSADDGQTWEEKEPLGFKNVMAFSSIIPKNPGQTDGKYIGFYHHSVDKDGTVIDSESKETRHLEVLTSETSDAGFTWSEPKVVASVPGKHPCEPFAFWSPDESEICCLMRENTHKGNSLMMFSGDRGATWSKPVETSWELTGDRHIGVYAPDGRLVIAFRDTALNSPTQGHFVAWVGSFDDLKNARPGDYRVKLLHSFAGRDCGYPGVHLLPDGTILALTYIKYRDGKNKHSIVATRFKLDELDKKKNP